MLGLSIVIFLENKSADFGLRNIAHILQILESLQEHDSNLVLVEVVVLLSLALLDDVFEQPIHLHDVHISPVELADF